MAPVAGLPAPPHLCRVDDTPPMPWLNSGGQTRELLTWHDLGPAAGPAGGPTHGWTLRVSVATIDRDGPFSTLPGVQRRLVRLAGGTLALAWPGRPPQPAAGVPLAFDGGTPPVALLGPEGPCRVLNFMVRAADGTGEMRPAAIGDAAPQGAAWWGLFTLGRAPLRSLARPDAHAHAVHCDVPERTLAWQGSAGAEAAAWQLQALDLPAWWLHFESHRSAR